MSWKVYLDLIYLFSNLYVYNRKDIKELVDETSFVFVMEKLKYFFVVSLLHATIQKQSNMKSDIHQ